MNKAKQCRRGHSMAGDNVSKQKNSHQNVDGKRKHYVVRVCKACKKFRAAKKASGKKFRDMRFGARP